MTSQNINPQTEEFSKKFSLKLAEKLENGRIDLARMEDVLVDFFNLLSSGVDQKKIEEFIETL